MISIIISVLCLISLSVFLAIILKKQFLQTVFLSVGFVITVLFLFGILNFHGSLLVGYFLIIVSSIVTGIYSGYKIFKDREVIRKTNLVLGLHAIGALLILSLFLNYGRWFIGWDEFSHWGIVVKNMYEFDALGTISDSMIMFKGYLPGSSLFQYFFTRANPIFVEYPVYVASNILFFSMLCPFIKKYNLRTVLLIVAFILIPMMVDALFYSSVYVDMMMGCIFGFAIIFYFYNRYEKDLYGILSVTVAIFLLSIIKDIGLVLAFLCIVIYAVDVLACRRKEILKYISNKKKLEIKRIVLIAMPILALIISQLSWRIHTKITGIESVWDLSKINLFGLVSGNLQDYQAETVNNFLDKFFNVPFAPFSFSFFSLMVVFLIAAFAWFLLIKNRKLARRIMIMASLIFAGSLGYALMLLVLYVSVFSPYEAAILASYERYMATYLVGTMLVLLFVLTNETKIPHIIRQQGAKVVLAILILTAAGLACFYASAKVIVYDRILPNTIYARAQVHETTAFRARYEESRKWAPCLVSSGDRLYIVTQKSKGMERNVIYYTLYPFSVQTYYSNDYSVGTKIYYPEVNDPWTFVTSPENWSEHVLDKYTLVYLFEYDELFDRNYGNYFDDLSNNQLYRVEEVDGTLRLESLGKNCE